MKETLDHVERKTEEYFAEERRRLRAPGDLWLRVADAMTRPAARPRLRWRAVAVSAAAAVAIALTLTVVLGRFGSGGSQSADQVLAGAMDALMDPGSVGLRSYVGVAEFETETEVGSLASSDFVMTNDVTVQEPPRRKLSARSGEWLSPSRLRIATCFRSRVSSRRSRPANGPS